VKLRLVPYVTPKLLLATARKLKTVAVGRLESTLLNARSNTPFRRLGRCPAAVIGGRAVVEIDAGGIAVRIGGSGQRHARRLIFVAGCVTASGACAESGRPEDSRKPSRRSCGPRPARPSSKCRPAVSRSRRCAPHVSEARHTPVSGGASHRAQDVARARRGSDAQVKGQSAGLVCVSGVEPIERRGLPATAEPEGIAGWDGCSRRRNCCGRAG